VAVLSGEYLPGFFLLRPTFYSIKPFCFVLSDWSFICNVNTGYSIVAIVFGDEPNIIFASEGFQPVEMSSSF
jgi:hypothetical protein